MSIKYTVHLVNNTKQCVMSGSLHVYMNADGDAFYGGTTLNHEVLWVEVVYNSDPNNVTLFEVVIDPIDRRNPPEYSPVAFGRCDGDPEHLVQSTPGPTSGGMTYYLGPPVDFDDFDDHAWYVIDGASATNCPRAAPDAPAQAAAKRDDQGPAQIGQLEVHIKRQDTTLLTCS